MDRNMVFEMAKNELSKVVASFQLEDFNTKKEHIQTILNLMENVYTLSSYQLVEDTGENEEQNDEKIIETKNVIECEGEESQSQQSPNELESFIFHRKLRGGFINEIPTFVPEIVVRRLGLDHGDLVSAIEIAQNRYDFKLVKKVNDQQSDRAELLYGIVSKDGSMLTVSSYLIDGEKKNIWINESPFSFLLRDEDIREFDIKEGDIVDIAYNPQSPDYSKLVWKHNNEDVVYQKPQASSSYKLKIKKEPVEVLEDFKEQTILIIGCEPQKTKYKEEIEKRNGKFLWTEGVGDRQRLKSLIKKSDVVVLLTSYIRHQASYDTVDYCKRFNVNLSITQSLGVNAIINEINNNLKVAKAV